MQRDHKRAIDITVEIAAPTEEVWRALTEAEHDHPLVLPGGSRHTQRWWGIWFRGARGGAVPVA